MSLILILAVPAVAVLAVAAVAAARVVQALRRGHVPGAPALAGLLAALLLLAGALSLLVLLRAALSHSEQAKAAAPWLSLGVFLLVLGVPACVLAVAVRRLRTSARRPR